MTRLCKQIWMILTLDCEGSARLTSESLDRPLSWAEAVALKAHCLVCSKSRKLNRQMIRMQQAVESAFSKQAVSSVSTPNQMEPQQNNDEQRPTRLHLSSRSRSKIGAVLGELRRDLPRKSEPDEK